MVIPLPPQPYLREAEIKHILYAEEQDDVSCKEFIHHVLFYSTSTHDCQLHEDLKRCLANLQIQYEIAPVEVFEHDTRTEKLRARPVGPFLCRSDMLHPVCRLFDDHAATAYRSLDPFRSATQPFRALGLTGDLAQCAKLAVPTRLTPPLYEPKHKAISNRRILVKDIFALQGMRQSACNRAYLAVSDEEPDTAPIIQKLINGGAHIVGTAKLSSMISREEPAESLEVQVPFNPRGDGYQSPAGSSSGPAAAIASYTWLDYAIGTDSTGSSRRPAFVNGCFALRLSQCCASNKGLLPCFPRFDAPALFSRTIRGMSPFVKDWLELAPVVPKTPEIIVLEDYFVDDGSEQASLVEHFLKTCGVKISRLNLEQEWLRSAPDDAGAMTLRQYLESAGRDSFFYDFYHSTDDFRSRYEKTKRGRRPPVNQVTAYRWDIGQGISEQKRDDAMRRMEIYGAWLQSQLFSNQELETMVMLPIATAQANYRDSAPRYGSWASNCATKRLISYSEPFAQEAWDQLFLAPILRSPELTVPSESPFGCTNRRSKDWRLTLL